MLALRGPARAGAQQPSTGTLRGVVIDSVRSVPLAGAIVTAVRIGPAEVVEASSARTDSADAFAFRTLTPGTYLVRVVQSRVDSVGIKELESKATIHPNQTTTILIGTPSGATLRQKLCPSERSTGPNPSFVLGTVRSAATGAPVAGARVIAEWNDRSFDIHAAHVVDHFRTAAVETDRLGNFWICGLPVAQTLSLQAQVDSTHYSGSIRTEIAPPGLYVRDFAIDMANPSTIRDGLGAMRGTVRDTTGTPILGATVSEIGSAPVATTDSAGRFALSGIYIGTQNIHVMAIGYLALDSGVNLGPHPMRDVAITLTPIPARLPRIVTTAERSTEIDRLKITAPGFMRRFQRGFGVFFLADSIAKLNPLHTSDLFRLVPGFGVSNGLMLTRRSSALQPGGLCLPDTYIDGTKVGDGEVNVIAPMDVLAIEAYQVGQPAPVQYGSHACGVILVWTK